MYLNLINSVKYRPPEKKLKENIETEIQPQDQRNLTKKSDLYYNCIINKIKVSKLSNNKTM